MKSIHYLLLLLTISMSGCAMLTSDSALDTGKASSLTHLYIVPIEGTPIAPTYPDGILTTRVINLLSAMETDSLLNKNEIWEPSNEVAKKTKRHLETAGNYTITIAPDVEPLPGVESWETGETAMHWFTPLKNWYNEDPSSIDYSEQPNSDTVLEVSVGPNDFLYWRHYRLQIVMKLVDTATKSVLANAQCEAVWPPSHFTELIIFGFTKAKSRRFINSLFSGTGAGYKSLFRRTASIAIPECIESLGLQ